MTFILRKDDFMNKQKTEKIYFIKDLEDNCVDAIIIAKTSTKEDIQNSIYKAKENNNYTWDDLIKYLPSDCVIYDKWDSEVIYY